jgi:periplasmic divalent cation tolerance protein
MEEIVLVLTTLPEDFDADSLARQLLEARLAACVSVLPAQTSSYRWKGAIETARERQMVIKTISTRIGELRFTLRASHPYDLPEFLVVPVSGGDPGYLDWVRENARL